MSITIKKSDSIERMKRKLRNFFKKSRKSKEKKTFNPHDFKGALKDVFGDGLTFQKKIRNEWDR